MEVRGAWEEMLASQPSSNSLLGLASTLRPDHHHHHHHHGGDHHQKSDHHSDREDNDDHEDDYNEIFKMILVKKMSLLINVCLVGWSGWPTCACQLEVCPSLAWSRPHQAETQTAFCSTSQLVVRTEALGLHIMMMIVKVIMIMIVMVIVILSTSNRKRNKDVWNMGLVWHVKIVSLSYCTATGSITAFIRCKMYCRHHNSKGHCCLHTFSCFPWNFIYTACLFVAFVCLLHDL